MTSTFPHRVVLGALSIMSSGWSATAHADFQTASVYPSDGVTKDRFGDAVALASSLALVGAPGTGLHVGSVYMLNVANPSLPIELGRLFDDLRILIESEDEFSRRGSFERIFPTNQTRKYLKYFETPRYYNLLLNEWISKYHRMEERGENRSMTSNRRKLELS